MTNEAIKELKYYVGEMMISLCERDELLEAEHFFEQFPRAGVSKSGLPTMCRDILYGNKRACISNCSDCWNKPMEEE